MLLIIIPDEENKNMPIISLLKYLPKYNEKILEIKFNEEVIKEIFCFCKIV